MFLLESRFKMNCSKIKELFENSQTVYIFDVDGTLTPLEFGEYNHYFLNDLEWAEAIGDKDWYEENRPIKVLQDFIAQKDRANVFVATRVMNEIELEQKRNFLKKHYQIFPEHVFSVLKNEDKLKVMEEIHSKFPHLDNKYFVMIDDTVDVLNYIMDYSYYSTVHISSFFE